MHHGSPAHSPEESALIARFIAGDESVGDLLCVRLQPELQNAVARFFPDHDDRADVVQESLLAVLDYLRRAGAFEGSLARFAVTVASNRSRDILRRRQRYPGHPIEPFAAWIADPARSPLDHLEDAEMLALLRGGLAALDPDCRELLTGIYLRGESHDVFRRRAGLKSVQAIYYRRRLCLQSLGDYFQSRLGFRSSGGGKGGNDAG